MGKADRQQRLAVVIPFPKKRKRTDRVWYRMMLRRNARLRHRQRLDERLQP